MQSIKNVSRNGRTVMVTIHQPSIDIFESFDALVLLQRGGKVCFYYLPSKSVVVYAIYVNGMLAADAEGTLAVNYSLIPLPSAFDCHRESAD